ncbi:MAG: insulinase family protein [Deltaproteobacteria bacterium]|nr:insulinase family protein [Deltaproteobacteria bacterium]
MMLALLPSALLVAGLSSTPNADPALPFATWKLKNGMQVILHEDHRVPLVAVDVWVHVGSGDEVPGKSGFAHLFEHMMFQGSEHVAEDRHFAVLREVGASTINGTTNFDRTNYFEVVPSNQLETALWLESDRVGTLLSHVNEESLKNQRDVVRNERRQRVDNVPYGTSRMALFAALYPEGHPFRYQVIGKHEDIEGASLQDVRAFFRTWYAPANVTLALAGDVDEATARALVDKWFGSLLSPPRPVKRPFPVVALAKNERLEVKDRFAKLVRLQWTWHGAAQYSADDPDLGVVGDALGAQGWGRLHRRLVVDEPLAQDVSAGPSGMNATGQFSVGVTLKPGVDPARVEAIVREELVRLLAEGPSADEVRRSVVDTETNLLFSLDDLLGRAEKLQSLNHYTGDAGGLSAYLARVRACTPESARAAARRWLAKPRVLVITVPEQAPPATPAPGPSGGAK